MSLYNWVAREGYKLLWASCFILGGYAACPGQSRCAADWIAARNLGRNSSPAPAWEDNRIDVRPRGIAHIPVVVHVVYNTSVENISDAQIYSQIAILNQDFRRLNSNADAVPAPFLPLAADMELEFCLAATDPNGNPTSGITRQETPWSNIGQQIASDGRPRIHYTELGGTDAWDTWRYLNIWVGTIGSGILGFGSYPGAAPPGEDGLVIDPRYFGDTGLAALHPPHHLGRTTTHEAGHYFNLLHIWGPDETSCLDDDGVSDTPVQRGPYIGCPAYPQFSCGNSAMFMNFMDFTDDACMALFTEGQKSRLWATLTTVRSGLLDSLPCATTSAPGETAPLFSIRPVPNPVTAWISVHHPALEGTILLRIFYQTGSLCREVNENAFQGQLSLNVADLPSGWYILQLYAPDGRSYPAVFYKTGD